jgi:tetratricopeptide (TPR) repeat protein
VALFAEGIVARDQGGIVKIVGVVACLAFLAGCGGEEEEANTPRKRAEAEISQVLMALEVRPDAPLLHFQLGQLYQKHGYVDSARTAFERCVELYESFAEAHLQLAQIYYEDGDLERSVRAYEQTVRFDAGNATAYNNLGFVYKKLDRPEEAVKAYERAIAADSLFVQAYNNLGQLFKNREEHEQAIALFRRAIAIKPDFPEVYINLAGVYEDRDVDGEASVWQTFLAKFGEDQKYSMHARERLALLKTP